MRRNELLVRAFETVLQAGRQSLKTQNGVYMSASAVVAASAAAVSSVTTTASFSLFPALIAFVGTVVGAAIAQGVGLYIAHHNRKAESRKDAIRRAFDSAGSHMAKVTFDKYVLFCEEYARSYADALVGIIRNGPTREAMQHSFDLARVRNAHTLWIPAEIDAALQKYEKAMLDVGSSAHIVESVANSPQHANAVSEHTKRMYQRFCEITGINEWDGAKVTDELVISNLLRELRKMLGTEEFSTLRRATASLALQDIERASEKPVAEKILE
jgi:hypothetical protein